MTDLRRSATRGILWAYASRYSGKALVFVSTLVLARLLIQEDFGVAGYALVVIALLETLSGLGVGPALIYHDDNPRTRDTAFVLSLLAACVLLVVTWFAAPLVADFFRDPRATDVTRVLALALPLSALGNIHFALLEKRLQFGRKFVPDLANSVMKGGSAIVFALSDYGAWSLIYGQLLGTLASVIGVWIVMPWRPRLRLHADAAGDLLNYGSKIVVVGVLGYFVANLGNFLVGRYLGAAALGVYVLALRIPEVLIKESALVVNKVLFPVFSRVRSDPAMMGRGYIAVMRYLTLMVAPLGAGLAAVAEPFVLGLLSEKWAELIPVMRLSAIYTLLMAVSFNAGTVFKAIGRPGLIIKLSLLRLALLAPALWWAVTGPGTLVAVAWVLLAAIVVHLALSLIWVARLLGLSLADLCRSILPALVSAAIMFVVVTAATRLMHSLPSLVQLAAGIGVGAICYLGLIWFWQRDHLRDGYATLKASVASRQSSPTGNG